MYNDKKEKRAHARGQQKDSSGKYLEAFNDVFADILNVLLFEEEKIDPCNLRDANIEAVYKKEIGILGTQRRDILKEYLVYGQNHYLVIASFGMENQSEIDVAMPVRIMGYDFTNYAKQVNDYQIQKNKLLKKKKELKEHNENRCNDIEIEKIQNELNMLGVFRLIPVITVVLNFSDRQWKIPLSVKDMADKHNIFYDYMEDYKIRVFNIAYLSEEIRKKFQSDFRVVADFFAKRRQKDYTPSEIEIEHVEAVLEMLRVFAGDEKYSEIAANVMERKRKGEPITMCTFAEEMTRRGEMEGRREDIERMLRRGKTPEEIADFCGYLLEDVKKVQQSILQEV